jgi:predicted transcriptional regulator
MKFNSRRLMSKKSNIEADILVAIGVLGDEATGPAIARYVGKSEGHVFRVLSQMLREGDIDKAGRGKPYLRKTPPRSLVEVLTIAKYIKPEEK